MLIVSHWKLLFDSRFVKSYYTKMFSPINLVMHCLNNCFNSVVNKPPASTKEAAYICCTDHGSQCDQRVVQRHLIVVDYRLDVLRVFAFLSVCADIICLVSVINLVVFLCYRYQVDAKWSPQQCKKVRKPVWLIKCGSRRHRALSLNHPWFLQDKSSN